MRRSSNARTQLRGAGIIPGRKRRNRRACAVVATRHAAMAANDWEARTSAASGSVGMPGNVAFDSASARPRRGRLSTLSDQHQYCRSLGAISTSTPAAAAIHPFPRYRGVGGARQASRSAPRRRCTRCDGVMAQYLALNARPAIDCCSTQGDSSRSFDDARGQRGSESSDRLGAPPARRPMCGVPVTAEGYLGRMSRTVAECDERAGRKPEEEARKARGSKRSWPRNVRSSPRPRREACRAARALFSPRVRCAGLAASRLHISTGRRRSRMCDDRSARARRIGASEVVAPDEQAPPPSIRSAPPERTEGASLPFARHDS